MTTLEHSGFLRRFFEDTKRVRAARALLIAIIVATATASSFYQILAQEEQDRVAFRDWGGHRYLDNARAELETLARGLLKLASQDREGASPDLVDKVVVSLAIVESRWLDENVRGLRRIIDTQIEDGPMAAFAPKLDIDFATTEIVPRTQLLLGDNPRVNTEEISAVVSLIEEYIANIHSYSSVVAARRNAELLEAIEDSNTNTDLASFLGMLSILLILLLLALEVQRIAVSRAIRSRLQSEVSSQEGVISDQNALLQQRMDQLVETNREVRAQKSIAEHRTAQLEQAMSLSKIGTFNFSLNDHAFSETSTVFERLIGLGEERATSEEIWEHLAGITGGDDFKQLLRKPAQGETVTRTIRLSGDGFSRVVRTSVSRFAADREGEDDRIVGTILDKSREFEFMAVEARQTKVETFAKLGGGIAHDFNNLLSYIVAGLEALEDMPSMGPVERQAIRDLIGSALSGSEISNQLKFIGEEEDWILEPLDLPSLLGSFTRTVRKLLPLNISLTSKVDDISHGSVVANAGLLEASLLNLVMNAEQAIQDHGHIEISCEVVDAATLTSGLLPGASERALTISVSDDGNGIDSSVLPNVFEPFFTTKIGFGTGFGLSMVRKIVQSFDGEIELSSKVGVGTTATIYLPFDNCSPSNSVQSDAKSRGKDHQELRVILVEDNVEYRETLVSLLRPTFSEVIAFANCDDAKASIENLKSADVIISDLSVPGSQQGDTFLRDVARFHPNSLRILITGDASKISEVKDDNPAFVTLKKPFSRANLLGTLDQMNRSNLGPA